MGIAAAYVSLIHILDHGSLGGLYIDRDVCCPLQKFAVSPEFSECRNARAQL